MVFAADNCTYHFVLARVAGSGEVKFLLSRFEQQIPPVHSGSILSPQNGEAMNRSIPIPGLASARGNSEKDLLSRLHRDLGSALAGNLVPAVTIGDDLDHPLLGAGTRQSGQQSGCNHDPHYARIKR